MKQLKQAIILFITVSIQAHVSFKQEIHSHIPIDIECILGVDIGTVNCHFGIFSIQDDSIKLLYSLSTQTQEITNFTKVMQEVLDYAKNKYGHTIEHACIGVPGPFTCEEQEYIKAPLMWCPVDGADIKQHTTLQTIVMLNNFQIIGYGLDYVQEHIVQLNKAIPQKKAPKILAGVGAEVGSAYMIWQEQKDAYIVYPSEGAFSLFSPESHIQCELIDYLKSVLHKKTMTWCKFLSTFSNTRGIKAIYRFFAHQDNHPMSPDHIPDSALIFNSYQTDKFSRKSVDLFLDLYAQYVRSLAITFLPYGGIYLTGNVATQNIDLFTNGKFIHQFLNLPIDIDVLPHIPIYVVNDAKVGLYGAAHYLFHKLTPT